MIATRATTTATLWLLNIATTPSDRSPASRNEGAEQTKCFSQTSAIDIFFVSAMINDTDIELPRKYTKDAIRVAIASIESGLDILALASDWCVNQVAVTVTAIIPKLNASWCRIIFFDGTTVWTVTPKTPTIRADMSPS